MTNPLYDRACKAFDAMHQVEAYLKTYISKERFENLHEEFPKEFRRAGEIEREITGDTPLDIAESLYKEWENVWLTIAKSCRNTSQTNKKQPRIDLNGKLIQHSHQQTKRNRIEIVNPY